MNQSALGSQARTDSFYEWRDRFRNYFANVSEGKGLLRFKGGIKRAMVALGGALWALTVPVSVFQGYKILREGFEQLVSVESIVATAALFIAGGVIIAIATWDRLWNQVLHNFWWYFVLLIVLPAVLWAARFAQAPEDPYMLWYVAGGTIVLFPVISHFIVSKPPPDQKAIETNLDLAFAADVDRHLNWIVDQLGGGASNKGPAPRILRTFPDGLEGIGKPRGRYGLDGIPRINPQGFVALTCGKAVLSCEGAIDLTTGEIIHHRVREFEYQDISVLALEGTGSPTMVAGQRNRLSQMLRMAGKKPASNYKRAFTIGLPANASIVAVVHDGKILSELKDFEGVSDNQILPLTNWDDLREVWRLLSERKTIALKGRP
jgi:hypothetical protein